MASLLNKVNIINKNLGCVLYYVIHQVILKINESAVYEFWKGERSHFYIDPLVTDENAGVNILN